VMIRVAKAMLAALLTVAGGCSGGSHETDDGATGGDPPPPPPPPAPPPPTVAAGGIWHGELEVEVNGRPDSRTTMPVRALVTEDGQFRWILPETGQQIVGNFLVEGSVLKSSYGLMWYEFPWWITEDSEYQGSFDVLDGAIERRANLSGSFQSTWPDFLEYVGSFSLDYDPRYERDSSYELLAGTYIGTGEVLTIGEDGELFYQSSHNGCVGNGTARLIYTEFNLYSVRVEVSSCTGSDKARNGRLYTGLAYLEEIDNGFAEDKLELALSIPLDERNATNRYLWNLSVYR